MEEDFDFHTAEFPTTKEEQWKIDGCIYNPEAIRCPARAYCYRCGWNPQVERQRKHKMKEERNARHSV